MLWSRRRLLTAALGAALAPTVPADLTMARTGTSWLREAEALDLRAWSLTPAQATARTARLLNDLAGAIDTAGSAAQRRPMHAAAAIVGCVAARACRDRGGNPVVYLSHALQHATAAGDGPARAAVLLHQITTQRTVAPPTDAPRVAWLADEALAACGTGVHADRWRASALWWLAWAHSVTGERASAVVGLHDAEVQGGRAGWSDHAVVGRRAQLLSRLGHHREAVDEARRAVAGAWADGALTNHAEWLIVLGAALARAGSHDEAAATLDAAAHAPATVGAPGRLSTVRQVALLVPPGPHRAHLDEMLRG